MTTSAINKVLDCASLPTLTGVALKVLELTRDPGASMNSIAQIVQADPGLAARVLKTVNSSYYGLAAPCPSINRAMSMLGLNTLKSIVLGFSLVDFSSKSAGDGQFNMEAYWRRAVYGASGARALALRTKAFDPEEAFAGSLMQDIGVLASLCALKTQYMELLAKVDENHDSLLPLERSRLGFGHTDVGGALASKWKLPPQIVSCVSFHHDPDAAPEGSRTLVRAIALARMMSTILSVDFPAQHVSRFLQMARDWFGLDGSAASELLEETATGGKELSRALEVRTGAAPNVVNILAEARDLMINAQEAVQQESLALRKTNSELSLKTVTDALTGAFNRAHFESEIKAAFERAGSGRPVAVIFADADKFKAVNDTYGHQVGDAVLCELAKRLRDSVGELGTVCRYGGEEFAIILPNCNAKQAAQLAEVLRQTISNTPLDLKRFKLSVANMKVTASFGAAAAEPAASRTPDALTRMADMACYEAKRSGRDCVRTQESVSPAEKTPTATVFPVLVAEDDPLALRLLMMLLGKRATIKPIGAKNNAEALAALKQNPRPVALLCDMRMPDGSGTELIQQARTLVPGLPCILTSADPDPSLQQAALAVGADAFVDKTELCGRIDEWTDRLLTIIAASQKQASPEAGAVVKTAA